MEGNRRRLHAGYLGCGFLVLEIVSGGGSKAVGMKNGCLKGSNESPHFTRPISIDHSTADH